MHTDLFTNFIFNMRNNQTIVVLDITTLDSLLNNTTAHLFGFVTQTSAIDKVELVLSLWQRPRFLRAINVNYRCWTPEIVELCMITVLSIKICEKNNNKSNRYLSF